MITKSLGSQTCARPTSLGVCGRRAHLVVKASLNGLCWREYVCADHTKILVTRGTVVESVKVLEWSR